MNEAEFPKELLSVMARMGAKPNLEDHSKGQLKVSKELSSNGLIRIAPLMLLADIIVGLSLIHI